MNLKQLIHAYVKQMNSRSMPVQEFRSSLVYKREPVLACSPIPTVHWFKDKWESQGQSGATLWCSPKKACQRIAFDRQYWHDLERKLLLYYYAHLIDFAAAEML